MLIAMPAVASPLPFPPQSAAFLLPMIEQISPATGVFSNEFATVDLREDYANLSLPKEAKFKR